MKLFIVYAAVEDRQQVWPDKRSLPLQRVAGSNVLGHVLNQLREVQARELIVVVERDKEAVAAWIEDNIPQIEAKVIAVAGGLNPLQALASCREHFDNEPLLVALGNTVIEADYKNLEQSTAGVTLFTLPQQAETGLPWAGICHFRQGTDLYAALEDALQTGGTDFFSLLTNLQQRDLHIEERPAMMCLDTRTSENLLIANARLLGLGFGSEDAIERSYVEDFTVLPPVFLHETAVIENAVIGPFANIEAGARISGSIVRSSLIGKESTIDNAILDGSIIGSRAHVIASGHTLIVEDNEEISLTS